MSWIEQDNVALINTLTPNTTLTCDKAHQVVRILEVSWKSDDSVAVVTIRDNDATDLFPQLPTAQINVVYGKEWPDRGMTGPDNGEVTISVTAGTGDLFVRWAIEDL